MTACKAGAAPTAARDGVPVLTGARNKTATKTTGGAENRGKTGKNACLSCFRPKKATFAVLGPHPPSRRTKTGIITPATTANPEVLPGPVHLVAIATIFPAAQRPRQRPSKNRTVRILRAVPGEVLSKIAEACLAAGRTARLSHSAKRPRGMPIA